MKENCVQVFILYARQRGKTLRVNSHLVQLGVLLKQRTPNKVSILGTRHSVSSQLSSKVGIKSPNSASLSPSLPANSGRRTKVGLATGAGKGNENSSIKIGLYNQTGL